MKAIFTYFALAIFLLTSCESFSTKESDSKQSEGAKSMKIPSVVSKKLESPQQAQAKKEKQDAVFKKECETMNIYLTHRMSIFPNSGNQGKFAGMKLKFDLFNAASLATFENIELEVKFITRSGKIVKEETFMIDQPIGPNQSKVHTVIADISKKDYLAFDDTEVTIVGANCR